MGAEIAAGIVRSKDDQGRCQRFRFNALLFGFLISAAEKSLA